MAKLPQYGVLGLRDADEHEVQEVGVSCMVHGKTEAFLVPTDRLTPPTHATLSDAHALIWVRIRDAQARGAEFAWGKDGLLRSAGVHGLFDPTLIAHSRFDVTV